ncbi:hypothetical protein WL01_07030 [Burkholderia ubonensis]|nr:hypothetical protein WL01_07030 [Burkholderia ubonensis]KWB35637.1 hypothetical protein WL33_19045 [Burkholderia ubonensis]KWC30087.1 hypothetical protein WL50_28485 [Burkholderia ubonensis]
MGERVNRKLLLSQAVPGRRRAVAGLCHPPSSAPRADGVALEVAPGDYSTTSYDQPVFSAVNGGVPTTTGKTRLFSSGPGSLGAAASGAGSRIELRDTEIRTRGFLGKGIDVRMGGSALAERISIDTGGRSAHGVYVDDSGSRVDLAGSAIVTRGIEACGIAVNYAPGAIVNVADTLARTGCDYASALFMPGASSVAFGDAYLQTAGYAAAGVDARKAVSTGRARPTCRPASACACMA